MTDPIPNDGQPPVPPANPSDQPPHAAPPTQQYGQPNGQQPGTYGAALGGPMYPGGPSNPGGPTPPKKGLPGWAIALIIAGSVLVLGVIIAAVIVISMLVRPAVEDDCSAPGSCGQGLPPTASEEATEDPGIDPDDSGTVEGAISLDGSAEFGGPPVWGVPVPRGWEIIVFDQDGINQVDNPAIGCTFVTSQNVQDVDTSTTSDRPGTKELMQQLTDLIAGSATDVSVASEDFADLSVGAAGSSSTIEFAMDRVDYSGPAGEQQASVFFGRSMPHSGSYMWAQLDCPQSLLDGADSPLQEIIDKTAVVPQP